MDKHLQVIKIGLNQPAALLCGLPSKNMWRGRTTKSNKTAAHARSAEMFFSRYFFIGLLSKHLVLVHDITVDSVNCRVFTFQ